jgi:hypothetical protein
VIWVPNRVIQHDENDTPHHRCGDGDVVEMDGHRCIDTIARHDGKSRWAKKMGEEREGSTRARRRQKGGVGEKSQRLAGLAD